MHPSPAYATVAFGRGTVAVGVERDPGQFAAAIVFDNVHATPQSEGQKS
jgi:hypothetical protein